MLVFDGAPKPFDKDVIQGPAFAVHTDSNAVLAEYREEGLRGELSTLIRVEDLGGAIAAYGLFQGLYAETRIKTVGNLNPSDFFGGSVT